MTERVERLRSPEQVAADLGGPLKASTIRRLIKAGKAEACILDGRGTIALTDEQVAKMIAHLTKAPAPAGPRPGADTPFNLTPRSRAGRRRLGD